VRENDTIYHEDLQTGQHAQKPPPRQVYPRRGVEPVLEHPELQGSMRRSLSDSRAACLHQPAVLLPGLWSEPASRPQRRKE
jgi:hypothetical protein